MIVVSKAGLKKRDSLGVSFFIWSLSYIMVMIGIEEIIMMS